MCFCEWEYFAVCNQKQASRKNVEKFFGGLLLK